MPEKIRYNILISEWLNEMIGKQDALPKHAVPLITSDAIRKEKDALFFFVTPILNKPKPKPVVEKKEEETKKEDDKSDAPKEGEPATEKKSEEPVAQSEPMEVD